MALFASSIGLRRTLQAAGCRFAERVFPAFLEEAAKLPARCDAPTPASETSWTSGGRETAHGNFNDTHNITTEEG